MAAFGNWGWGMVFCLSNNNKKNNASSLQIRHKYSLGCHCYSSATSPPSSSAGLPPPPPRQQKLVEQEEGEGSGGTTTANKLPEQEHHHYYSSSRQRRRRRHGGDDDDVDHHNYYSPSSSSSSSSSASAALLLSYLQQSEELAIRSNADRGPPRWFSYRHSGTPPAPASSSPPLLLFLPGLLGVGSGLALQSTRLTQIFEVWCLHIPLSDRTPFIELVKLVEQTVISEHSRRPSTPIYLLGESFGGCLALAIAARNPHLHLILILANPATCFSKSHTHALLPLSEFMPGNINLGLFYLLSLASGFPSRMAMDAVRKGLPLHQTFGELAQNSAALSSYISVLADLISVETINWKLKMLKSAADFVNSRLHAVKARTLILSSGRDQLLPSQEEAERLRQLLRTCDVRIFGNRGHALFLEDGFDLVTVIKGACFYQQGRSHDYVSDYLPPEPFEFKQIYEPHRWMEVACNPVMLSTLENGKIVRGLSGVPSKGPVLFVGYHMMLGFELIPLVARFWTERNIVLRGVAHPLAFRKVKGGKLPDLSTYDHYRSMGAVPVSAANLYKLFSSKSHVLLYPGGMREALHRKGEEHKLIWPEQSEFVRMAARFGAKIVPFGAVGEDDFGQLLFDYDDQVKIPYLKAFIEELTAEAEMLRSDVEGEVGKQYIHLPIGVPKFPGRLYFHFGKPIETEGRRQELRRSREESQRVYAQVKSEVESCIAYLKGKREEDPYRNIVARLTYQAMHGFDSEVPTFDF